MLVTNHFNSSLFALHFAVQQAASRIDVLPAAGSNGGRNPYLSAFLITSYIDVSFSIAKSWILSKLVFPIPRFGSFITLVKLRLSIGFWINLKYEIISFISFLSKNFNPPTTLYGIPSLPKICSIALDCVFIL